MSRKPLKWDPLLRRWVRPVPVQPPVDLADWLRERSATEKQRDEDEKP